jgi:Reverse transcriptase (RNA-dependent DNA polymerase)
MWQTLRSLKATTPGPDGISNMHLKKLFDIIGPLIIDAWQHSLQTNELMSSHKNSFLRLIPKPGKDTRELKNWRPNTLSNCNHKLITKTYNTRLLNIIKDYITPTQTAYIKGRNIADNLRLLNALTKKQCH